MHPFEPFSNFWVGGDLREETKKFFSPYAVWTRLPALESDDDSTSIDEGPMGIVGNAVEAYVRTYTTLFDSSNNSNNSISEDFLSQYLEYRIDKDPAKRLLIGE